MKSNGLLILFLSVVMGSLVAAADGKVEISPYAGGFFSSGFHSYQVLSQSFSLPGVSAASATRFKPLDEINSGVFGVRGSYDMTARLTLEGTFGFSPAGRKSQPLTILPFLSGTSGPTTFAPLGGSGPCVSCLGDIVVPTLALQTPVLRGGHIYSYSGNLLVNLTKESSWKPFLTVGLGGMTRTGRIDLVSIPFGPGPFFPGFRVNPALPGLSDVVTTTSIVPDPTQTDLSVNFGGGVKKYFSEHVGIRFDARNYVSRYRDNTVNNTEVSAGLLLRF